MKKKLLVGLVAVNALFLGMVGGASATGFGFSNTFDSLTMTADGISLEISAYTIGNDGNGKIFNKTRLSGDTGVYLSSSGNIGVLSNTLSDGKYLDGGVDGNSDDLDEGLLFSYDQRVSLNYINFDRFGSSDDFNLTVDGVTLLVDWNDDSPSSSLVTGVSGQFDEYYFHNIFGQEFLFWADGNSDSFKIDNIEVSAAPVPEPASMLLFGSGILGLLGSRLRRKKNA